MNTRGAFDMVFQKQLMIFISMQVSSKVCNEMSSKEVQT